MKYIIVAFLSLNFICLQAQEVCKASKQLSSQQLVKTEEAVKLFWKWDSIEEPEKGVELLEAIVQNDKKNWVAPFWASYISTQLSNQRKDSTRKLAELNKAQEFLEKAYLNYSDNSDQCFKPYFHALQTLIYTLKRYTYSTMGNKNEAKKFAGMQNEELNIGIKLSPENPVLMVLSATSMASNSNGDFKQIIGAIALLEKAKQAFKQLKDRNPVDIGYMNEHWVDNWLRRLQPPKKS
ncbi:MAG: hypothetical protein QNJ57_10825 [Flavobacteriaceae bacterium]|nr:hypothetical protein [Flavobacteriaceae bacterium]